MGWSPTQGRILAEESDRESVTAGGIVLPDSRESEAYMVGRVVAIGAVPSPEAGHLADKRESQCDVGDTILFKTTHCQIRPFGQRKRQWLLDFASVLAVERV